jgi:hypothetical protein
MKKNPSGPSPNSQRQLLICFYLILVLLVLELHINGDIEYILFSPSIVSFIHVIYIGTVIHFFLLLDGNMLQIAYPFLVDVHLIVFSFSLILL